MVLAEPIVALIFEHGEFTAADTVATARALQLYAIGLVGYSIVRIVSPTFYALQQSRIPVIVSAASVVVNVLLNVVLVRVMGYRGLALGTSVAAIVNAAVQLWCCAARFAASKARALSPFDARRRGGGRRHGAPRGATPSAAAHAVPGDDVHAMQATRLRRHHLRSAR